MENYTYSSYPESGDSSPRSREIDFENPTPWDDQNNQPPPNYKVKFMCSYGGKIQPRPHDNQLSYVGGDTKILSVERNIKFATLVSKLASACDSDAISFKYQLPGEDLDALISVTSDDDLDHMMHEYDRLYRVSPRPARLRLFVFPLNATPSLGSARSFGSEEGKSEKDRFVEALNSGPVPPPLPAVAAPPSGSADFLFGSEKGIIQPPPPQQVAVIPPKVEAVVREPEMDPIQKHIQDLQRLQIEEQQGLHRRRSDENLAGGYAGGEYYFQKAPEKLPPPNNPATTGYWQEKQVPGGGIFPANAMPTEQPVYMIQTPAGAYHTPVMRSVTAPPNQGYYAVQRLPPEAYREQPMYNVVQSVPPPVQSVAAAPPTLPQHVPHGYGMVRPVGTGGVTMAEAGYAQVAYDGAGRQVYYQQAPGGGGITAPPQQQVQQYQAMPGVMNQDGGKVAGKPATQASV